jgi:hypothetical protein
VTALVNVTPVTYFNCPAPPPDPPLPPADPAPPPATINIVALVIVLVGINDPVLLNVWLTNPGV